MSKVCLHNIPSSTPWAYRPALVCLPSDSRCRANIWRSRGQEIRSLIPRSFTVCDRLWIATTTIWIDRPWKQTTRSQKNSNNNETLNSIFIDFTECQVPLDGLTSHHRFRSSGSHRPTDGRPRALHPLADRAAVWSDESAFDQRRVNIWPFLLLPLRLLFKISVSSLAV
jgi:hypothetical protein